MHMIDNLGGRLGSFDRLEKELAPGQRWSGFDRAIGGGAFFAAKRDSLVESQSAAGARRRGEADAAGERASECAAHRQPFSSALKRPPASQPTEDPARQARARQSPQIAEVSGVARRLPLWFYRWEPMAKDTEKLIRQLSLISYLMAERRPVTALEIKRDVEGYSGMNEDAFARRFYADRAELESLRIQLTVEKPLDGVAEQENYSLRPENFHLPGDRVHRLGARGAADRAVAARRRVRLRRAAAPRAAADHLGPPEPAARARAAVVALGITASAGGHELSQRLAKIETAIFRHKTITFDYYTMERDEIGPRSVDPYHLLFRGGQFYLLGYSHEREALRVFRLSRIRGKVAYATKAEHDFRRPTDFDPRAYANLADVAVRRRARRRRDPHLRAHRLAARAPLRPLRRDPPPIDGERRPRCSSPSYANAAQLISWVLGLGEHARLLGPAGAGRASCERRLELLVERHTDDAGSRERRRRRRRAPSRRARAARQRRRRRRRARSAQRRRDPPGALRAAGHARVDPDPGRPRRRAR